MKVYIKSRIELERMFKESFPNNTAIISYYGSKEKMVKISDTIKHIIVNLDDVNPIYLVDNPINYKEIENWHINEFNLIASFIKECIELDMDIICQCEYGISRSSGTAMAIREYLYNDGIKIYRDYRYMPNKLFFNNIYNCLNKMNINNGKAHY